MQTALERERTAKQICSELNQFVDLKSTLIIIIDQIKELVDIEAVSIRLHKNNDYPYYVYNGFPESFIHKENSLCSKDLCGENLPETTGNGFQLDCMCGNIIRCRTNPEFDFFTKGGSFWSNSTTILLKSTSAEDRQANTRNYCNSCGYESVALVPIKNKTGIIGLIQLNDTRINKFTIELIQFLEMIGEQIGVAVESAMIYEDLLANKKQLEETLTELHYSQNQLVEAKKMASLGLVVAGIAHEMNTPLSNASLGMHTLFNNTKSFANKIDASDQKNPELVSYLTNNISLSEVVLRNIERTSKLVTNFKNASTSVQESKVEAFNFKSFLNDIINSIKPTVKDKNISFNLIGIDGYNLTSYPSCFFQIFSNLIMNSYIHGFENQNDGTITIQFIEENKYLSIKYSDNGIGIQSEYLPKIFEPFYTTKKSTCSGLGLSIVYNLINKQLKGTIVCRNSNPKGIEFAIIIPIG